MMKFTLTFLIVTLANFAAFAQSQPKCFRNETLQGRSVVNFTTDKNNALSGTYSVEITGEEESARTYEFGGNRRGKFLTVLFEQNVLPDVAPSYIKSVVWVLEKKGDREVLEMIFYGKNYETNKYANYRAEFEPCSPNHQVLSATAKPVRFAKGKTSASVPLSFKNTNEQKAFSINIRKGQTLEINAAGCKLSIYLPSGKLYEFVEWQNESGSEKTYTPTMIDRAIVDAVPQTGNYLVIVQKMADDAHPDLVIFKIKNKTR